MRLELHDLNWICDQVRIKRDTRLRQVLTLRLVECYTYPAIAAEMQMSEATARWHFAAGRKRILAHQWRCKLQRELVDQLEVLRMLTPELEHVAERALSDLQEAQALLDAMHAPTLTPPPVAVYDELGRRVGAPATMVTLDDVARLLRQRRRSLGGL